MKCNNFLFVATASGKEKADFLSEIDMMKKIAEGYNPHIVNMVGCVTLQEPLCLITEFVPFGDLLSFLRSNRKKVKRTFSFLHESFYSSKSSKDKQIYEGYAGYQMLLMHFL